METGARNLWVTQTALGPPLNMTYVAEQLALFGIVVGVALLLAGVGFVVLAVGGALHARPTTSWGAPPRGRALRQRATLPHACRR